jgi:UDP-4-amino-4,6-dideoxy-N-acetyl-beta-L-altrosamine N-acetyltransferase
MMDVRFVKLNKNHLPLLYEWRTSGRVSQFQMSNMHGNYEEHVAWYEKVSRDFTTEYWIIKYAGSPIGVFNLACIDHVSKNLSAGYYIGEINYLSLGGIIPPFFYNYIFFELGFSKIWGKVFFDNVNVRKIHSLHGFKELEILKDNVSRDGAYHDVVSIELSSKDWFSLTKFHKYRANFKG